MLSDEWRNFLERMQCEEINENDKIVKNEERDWASFRGQTLSRTGKLYR